MFKRAANRPKRTTTGPKDAVEFRKRDLINSLSMVGFCLIVLTTLHFAWVRPANSAMRGVRQRVGAVQAELVRYREAMKKLAGLSKNIELRRYEKKAPKYYFPSPGEILGLHAEIYNAALTHHVKINKVERGEIIFLEAGFFKEEYIIELTGIYKELLKFITHFEADSRPIYFSRLKARVLSEDTIQMNLQMVVYGLEEEGSE